MMIVTMEPEGIIMSEIRDARTFMRVVHRYLGFFLAGIVMLYAVSGIVLIYRDTDFLKKERRIEKTIATDLNEYELAGALRMKQVKIGKIDNGIIFFNENGTYNSKTGEVAYTAKELPWALQKMTQFHKATSKNPLSVLNVFFGISLFFFALSSFWMFQPHSKIFKKGLLWATCGFILAFVLALF